MKVDKNVINKVLAEFITNQCISELIYQEDVTKTIEYTLCEINGASKFAEMLKKVIGNE